MTDAERFERLWGECSPAVLRYAARRVTGTAADDVVAETFVVAWRRLAEVPEPALPWLLGVARGVAANSQRSVNRQSALAFRVAAQPSHLPEPAGTDYDGEVLLALSRLSEADRELLTLIAWDGLKPHEAAQVLACSATTLRVRLSRARGRLRKSFDEIANVRAAEMENR